MPIWKAPAPLSFLIGQDRGFFMIELDEPRDRALPRADFPWKWQRHAVLVEGVEGVRHDDRRA